MCTPTFTDHYYIAIGIVYEIDSSGLSLHYSVDLYNQVSLIDQGSFDLVENWFLTLIAC